MRTILAFCVAVMFFTAPGYGQQKLSAVAGKIKLQKTGEGPIVISDTDVGHVDPLLLQTTAPPPLSKETGDKSKETGDKKEATETEREVPDVIRKRCASSTHPKICENVQLGSLARLQQLMKDPPRFVTANENQVVFAAAASRYPGDMNGQLGYVHRQHSAITSIAATQLSYEKREIDATTSGGLASWEEHLGKCYARHLPDFERVDFCAHSGLNTGILF